MSRNGSGSVGTGIWDTMPELSSLFSSVKVKVYHQVWSTGRGQKGIEQSMIFHSKEFGWMEYYDDGGSPLMFKSRKDLIKSTYTNMSTFTKYGKLQYLGEL